MHRPPNSKEPKTFVNFVNEGVQAFRGLGNNEFPMRVLNYRGSVLVVPDWNINHDHGDEDDGETKAILKTLRRCPVCDNILQGGAFCPRCKEYHD